MQYRRLTCAEGGAEHNFGLACFVCRIGGADETEHSESDARNRYSGLPFQ